MTARQHRFVLIESVLVAAFMCAAREEAGIPHAEYRELIEDVAMADDLGDLKAIWAEMERPNVKVTGA